MEVTGATGLKLGEYLRRLRRARGWNLQQLADATGISYSHLSRIENDSTMPNADSVAKLAIALDGDLRLMLEQASCLPRIILERIQDLQAAEPAGATLHRGFVTKGHEPSGGPADVTVGELCRRAGLSPADTAAIASAVEELVHLPAGSCNALVGLIHTWYGEVFGGRR